MRRQTGLDLERADSRDCPAHLHDKELPLELVPEVRCTLCYVNLMCYRRERPAISISELLWPRERQEHDNIKLKHHPYWSSARICSFLPNHVIKIYLEMHDSLPRGGWRPSNPNVMQKPNSSCTKAHCFILHCNWLSGWL